MCQSTDFELVCTEKRIDKITRVCRFLSDATGTPAKPFRVALGTLLIKKIKGICVFGEHKLETVS